MYRPWLNIARFACVAIALSLTSGAYAAEITHIPLGDKGELKGVEVILISGDIIAGDEEKFRALSVRYDSAIIALDSRGGALLPSIEIGKMIHLKEYVTLVAEDGTCTSACALIWVAGSTRFLSPAGHVGFHASYKDVEGRQEETGVGNALVGHYLGLLNFPEKAIIFATSASPSEIEWLTADNMSSAGIEFEAYDDNPKPPPLVRMEPTPVASLPAPRRPHGWVEVARGDNSKYYLNYDDIADIGTYRSAWEKGDFSTDPSVKYTEARTLWLYDCPSRRMALKAFIHYDRQGRVTESHEYSEYELSWSTVAPDTVGEAKLDFVCN